ncbi:MAG: CRISPR-associated endonuclease Cas1 [Cyanobacteriota bacterium]|nr:CRISPR-associated endonuclease Cas1 [Cyanobacteriota bacterium]
MKFTLYQLQGAWGQVRSRSRSAGVDGITVDWFASLAPIQLQQLHDRLQRESYIASPAKGFYLPKPRGGKRLLGIPTVRDRIVGRVLLEEMYFPLEDVFLDCSYAYRPGRGIQTAVKHLHFYYQHQPTWVIKADIERFFDRLCWGVLLSQLERLPLEMGMLPLIEGQLKSGIVLGGRYLNFGQGVLQGSVLSGALANLYLSEFDRQCLQNGINLVRYGDDLAIACGSWPEATRTLERIREWLASIYLHLQPEKTHIFSPDEEFIFLGHRLARGRVYPPPPPKPRTGEWMLTESGRPYFRPQTRKPPKPESRPPKACSLSRLIPPKVNLSHYWRDPMTTLYVTEQGAYLKVRHQQFQVFYQRELRVNIPAHRISHIVLFGCCNLSHGAVNLALRRRIPILYLSHRGRYFGRLQTDGLAKVEYLTRQVLYSQNPEFVRQQAEAIILAKLHNSRILLMRLNRRHSSERAAQAVRELDVLQDKLCFAEEMDALRGYEGKGATIYFQALGSLFSGRFEFEKRTKRPPTDPINSMLSLGYTLLHQNVGSFVQAVGLHGHFGNLHVPRDNHPALVSDLMEEWRAQLVDSLVVYLVNSQIFTLDDFTNPDERGGVYFQPHALKKFLKHWEEKLQTEITHPHSGQRVVYRRCIELQVREYIARLMDEVSVYRPMIWKM